jgi:hypothetical protein
MPRQSLYCQPAGPTRTTISQFSPFCSTASWQRQYSSFWYVLRRISAPRCTTAVSAPEREPHTLLVDDSSVRAGFIGFPAGLQAILWSFRALYRLRGERALATGPGGSYFQSLEAAPKISSIFSRSRPCKSFSLMRPSFTRRANTKGSIEYR